MPVAFSSVFSEEFAGLMDYDVQIPYAYAVEKGFSTRTQPTSAGPAWDDPAVPESAARTNWRSKLDNQRFYWLLANTSLLVPVLLAFAVLYFAWKGIGSLREEQSKQYQPIIERQSNML